MERIPVGPSEVLLERNVEAAMRDGTVLRADVYRPDTADALPVILMRVPYGKANAQSQVFAHPLWYAQQGYVVAVQDTRGRGSSDGDFYPFLNEADDGYDTIEWAADLEGANGTVGTYGFSYAGMTQLAAAVAKPPSLRCIAPAMTGPEPYDGWIYRGGVLCLAFAVSWAMRLAADDAEKKGETERARLLREALLDPTRYFRYLSPGKIPMLAEDACPYFQDWLKHPTPDAYWKRWNLREALDRVTIPALHLGGWYDTFKDGTVENFVALRDNAKDPEANQLVMGPWYHMPWTSSLNGHDFGGGGVSEVDRMQVRWFNRWLKDRRVEMKAPVRIFIMGRNTWQSWSAWPPPGTKDERFYLDGAGPANSLDGSGSLMRRPPAAQVQDIYTYDPGKPVQSLGGHSCCVPAITPMGPKDQRIVELQNQVLVYDSDPLQGELLVSGRVRARLWVATSAVDTDFVAKLVDVWPDGKAINICEGIARMGYRLGLERKVPMARWDLNEIEIDLGSTCVELLPGHCVRLEITSSCFPQWQRNSNTDEQGAPDSPPRLETATQIVFRGGRRPSHLILPVLPHD